MTRGDPRRSVEAAAYTELLATIGLNPLVQLKVAPNPSRHLPGRLEYDADTHVQAALTKSYATGLSTLTDARATAFLREAFGQRDRSGRGTNLPATE